MDALSEIRQKLRSLAAKWLEDPTLTALQRQRLQRILVDLSEKEAA